MTINDEARRNLAIAIEAPITLGLMALNGAWHPFWLLSWLVNKIEERRVGKECSS